MYRNTTMFRAADYLRLSKEDGDFSLSPGKVESNSISSQRDLIRSYVAKCPDIELVAEYVDDGFTGTTFDRPNFKKMMEAVERGEINCIIVKDLSRFGREYIDAGQYIEKLFPQKGVRFIAVNDHYDSLTSTSASDSLMIPFKNLINDSYSRDISIKIRTNLEAKRRRGEFIANYTAYGYRKDPQDKNRLIVDDEAARIVRSIFTWCMEGFSSAGIARKLNEQGILSPSAYKRSHGIHFQTAFQTGRQTQWSSIAIKRILTNEIYCGTLIQGRTTTVNYKIKTVIAKDEKDWARIENAHEALIDKDQFDIVQRLLTEDSRSLRDSNQAHPLSGRVFCGVCGSVAKRVMVSARGRKYTYYFCPACKKEKRKSGRLAEKKLTETVLILLRAQIDAVLDADRVLTEIDALAWEKREVKRLDAAISSQEALVARNNELKVSVYEDYREGMIDRNELAQIKDELSARIEAAERVISELRRQRENVQSGLENQKGWLAQFRAHRNLKELTRVVVVTLIDRIELLPNKEIRVQLRQTDQLRQAMEFAAACGTVRDGASGEAV